MTLHNSAPSNKRPPYFTRATHKRRRSPSISKRTPNPQPQTHGVASSSEPRYNSNRRRSIAVSLYLQCVRIPVSSNRRRQQSSVSAHPFSLSFFLYDSIRPQSPLAPMPFGIQSVLGSVTIPFVAVALQGLECLWVFCRF